ncbi:zinc ribbon domain-containing protein [bacterium]|nr:zinc ribbon domain-containing protein [bacterium]
MPTYDYVCKVCGYEFEAFQNITEEPLKKCPKCRGKVKRKIGSGAGLIFKGSGFYITDYKRKSNAVDSAKPEKADPKKESSTQKPTEAKK